MAGNEKRKGKKERKDKIRIKRIAERKEKDGRRGVGIGTRELEQCREKTKGRSQTMRIIKTMKKNNGTRR